MLHDSTLAVAPFEAATASSAPGACHSPLGLRDPLAAELRDGVLQDLLAVSMLITAARSPLHGAGCERAATLLDDARAMLQEDVAQLRGVIGALDRAGADRWRGCEREERSARTRYAGDAISG